MRWLVLAVVAASACRGSEDAAVPPVNAVELADSDALEEARSWAKLPIPSDRVYWQQSSVDRGTGVDGGVRLLQNGNKDLNNWVCASADAELGRPLVPAVFDAPSCAEKYVRGAVAARFEGSGRMTRFWMTALSMRSAPADDEMLRVYVDDELVVEHKLAAVADGTAGEMFAKPYGAGTSRFVSWRYPVVFGRKLIIALDNLGTLDNVYHITDVALDPAPRPRRRAESPLPRDVAPLLDTRTLERIEKTLAPGAREELKVGSPTHVLSVARPDLLRDVNIQLQFDGVTTVDMSIAELFAAWEELPATSSYALATEGDRVSLRLPMSAGLTVAVENRGSAPAPISLRAATSGPSAGGGRLWAVRRETVAPATGVHPVLEETGPGRWVGTCALLEGHAMPGSDVLVEGFNFLEGDERATIDGVLAIPGTGTEDYFDSAFYFLGGARSTLFAAWWGAKEDRSTTPWRGRAAACRWHVLNDAIDFHTSVQAELEIGNGDPSLLDRYRSVAFFYR